jgi:Family of unknown function (DUF5681)
LTAEPEKSAAKQHGRFKPSQSGNPAGKPKGTRHRITRAIEELLDGEAGRSRARRSVLRWAAI